LTQDQQAAVMAKNAIRFYRINQTNAF